MGICEGYVGQDGVRVHFNSLHAPPEGISICGPCILAYPEAAP